MSKLDNITVRCCGCTGEVTFVVPKTGEDLPTLFHTVPYCTRFGGVDTAEDLADYVRDCRVALEPN